MTTRTVLHLTGSATSSLLDELSLLYARDCLAATGNHHEAVVAHVDPNGSWRLPATLAAVDLAASPELAPTEALIAIVERGVDVVLPQLFCLPGMTTYRSLWAAVGLPVVGNTGTVMAVGADKAWTRAVLAAAGVDVPQGQVVERGGTVDVALPVVVKPVDADNSVGVSLVRSQDELTPALEAAWAASPRALVERFVPAGREVRCGVLDLDGELRCLPLEEYRLDPDRPVRAAADKLGRAADGDLRLMAKDGAVAWSVDPRDPVTEVVWEVVRRCHRALSCRDHSLWDVRVDPEGRPWVLEASLYCSFARQSVVVMMAAAAGVPLEELFSRSVDQAVQRGPG